MEKNKGKQIILYLILLSFLSIKIFHLLNQKGITWDSAVYIGMGKYIFSMGKIGLWEPARPLVWPIMLGFLWKIGLSPIIFGKILELVFSLGCVYVTYLIGKDIFDEKISLLAVFFLGFTPIFLFYSSSILTGMPSTFFALLAIYLFTKKGYFLSGLFIGVSFMMRFLQLFILIPVLFLIIFKKRKQLKNIVNLAYGFSIMVLPYLVLNTFLYKNPLYPFMLQIFMSKHTGWVYHQAISFYFINLLKENFLILFAITGIIIILKQKDYKKTTILTIFLLFFVFFNSIAHKETRFIITFLPYLYLVTSYGILKSSNLIKNKKLASTIILLLCIIWLVSITNQIVIPTYKEYPEFGNYLETNNVKGEIWVSNPIFIVSSNQKPDELIYYPLYNSKKINTLKEKLPEAKHILIDTCDILPCPEDDKNCPDKTINFLNYLKNNFRTIHYKKEANCEEFIFSSP